MKDGLCIKSQYVVIISFSNLRLPYLVNVGEKFHYEKVALFCCDK